MIQLSIDPYLEKIITDISKNRSVVLTASPGSGKTTRLPPALIKAKIFASNKKIVILVPKRLAAVSACVRIADEQKWKIGHDVGYQVRFEKEYSDSTQLLFMTEGVFLKKFSDENFTNSLGLVIFDEFHERTALADLALGLCYERQILTEAPKILVMSATLDSTGIKNFLETPTVVDVVAPPHPLQIIYSSKAQRLVCDEPFYVQLVDCVKRAWQENKQDVLCFLPGLPEIRKATNALGKFFSHDQIQILHSSISLDEQQKILKPYTSRRIILSTNIAESSLTVPTVDAVIDSGLQKLSKIDSKIGFSKLETVRISQFSAKQRAGRAARTGPGRCYRLWHETDELSMPKQIVPEIKRSNLISECLFLAGFNIDQCKSFSWLDMPSEILFTQAQEKLKSWGLIDNSGAITKLGQKTENCPLDVEKSVFLILLAERGFAEQAIHFVTALETCTFSDLFKEKVSGASNDIDRIIEATRTAKNSIILAEQLKVWLKRNSLYSTNECNLDFQKNLIQIIFKYFPEKVGKIKSNGMGISSLGRGFQLLQGLQANQSDYVLLLAGREINSATTAIDFAIGFSKSDFLTFGSSEIELIRNYEVNFEKQLVYEIQQKRIGQFVISENSKVPLTKEQTAKVWSQVLKDNLKKFLDQNEQFKKFIIKKNFIEKFALKLNIDLRFFKTNEEIIASLEKLLLDATFNVGDLNKSAIEDYVLTFFDDNFQKTYKNLPEHFKLPNGKLVRIDYESESSPMISVKIQDIFGQKTNPTIAQGLITLTIELLAPNYRPAQITSQLVQFWQTSYQEIAKELKSRYPRHPWPIDPMNFVPLAPIKKN